MEHFVVRSFIIIILIKLIIDTHIVVVNAYILLISLIYKVIKTLIALGTNKDKEITLQRTKSNPVVKHLKSKALALLIRIEQRNPRPK